MARAADFDLARELAKPSFTPGQRDAPALVELVVAGDEPTVGRATAALAKLGEPGRRAIEARLGDVEEAPAARLVTAVGLFAREGDAAARSTLVTSLGDARVRVRRAAIVALGKVGGDAPAQLGALAPWRLQGSEDARAALVARWDAADVTPDERRALAEALGKLGGDAALARLRALEAGGDAELARRRDRALLMADRSAKRHEESTVATDVPPPSPLVVRLHCKQGLGELLAEELRARGLPPLRATDAWAELRLDRPWSALFASRLWATAGIRVALPSQEPDAIVRTIISKDVRGLVGAWTRGAIRWRLAFPSGHRRAVVWRVARDVAAAAPELVNDPTTTTWDVIVDDAERALELSPRRAEDPRFAWRVAEVPAASHPTVAAALALVGGAQPGDRVWDPFAGSGAELVERAKLGPLGTLIGTDVSDEALAASRANLDAAGITATLARGDARTHAPGPVDLIITNPPLGSRVKLDAAALLVECLPNFARALAPGGRMAWITPATRKTSPAAEQLGLRRVRSLSVDLGGVRGQLERWDRQ